MAEPTYVPILKGREGEYAALEVLNSSTKDSVIPLIEVPPVPYDFVTEAPAKSIDEHVGGVPIRIWHVWSGRPFYLDLSSLAKETEAIEETALISVLGSDQRVSSQAIPVMNRESSDSYVAVVRAHAKKHGAVCVRLTVTDFADDINLEEVLNRLVSGILSDGGKADLIVDLGDLGAASATAPHVARSTLSLVPQPKSWRRMILAGASFPEDLSEVSAATVVNLPRREWNLWKTLQARPAALPRRDLIFGDYAMAHPKGRSLDPRTMRMSANIRYTTLDDWLIIKGRNVRQYGFNQYFELCRSLIERPEYMGRSYSWGDTYIGDCADATQGPGNATTWRKVGVNHHITLVTRELASLKPSV